MNPRVRGTFEISIASACFGFLGIFGKWAFSGGLSVGELLTYRFSLAAFLLWFFLILFRPKWVRLSLKETFIAALLGIFGYAFFSTLYFEAVQGLSVTLAALLLYTYPFWVNIFSHFFTRDKLSLKEFACLVGASSGLILLLWGHIEVHNFWAVLMGLGSAISYAIYVLVSGRWQKNVRPISSALYVITFGALALTAFHQPSLKQIPALTSPEGLSILGLAVICTVIPLTLELAALQKLRSKEVALLMMIEPITAAFMGAVIFKESLSSRQLIGALLIATSLFFNSRAQEV